MHIVWPLVRTRLLLHISENSEVILCKCTKLIVLVLEAKVCQLDLEDDFFANLSVYWDPYRSSLLGNFLIVVV